MAVAAFLVTIGGTAAAKALQQETKWFHIDANEQPTGQPMDEANCNEGEPLCSVEYYVDASENPLTPTGNEAFGTPRD